MVVESLWEQLPSVTKAIEKLMFFIIVLSLIAMFSFWRSVRVHSQFWPHVHVYYFKLDYGF